MILSIDPGETTGLALRRDDGVVAFSMCRGKEQLWKLLEQLKKGDKVCIEDFITAGRISKHGLYTTRLVGSVEALCWRYDLPLQRQVPSFRTAWLGRSVKFLEQTVGLDHEHRHEKDALAHLMAYEDWSSKLGHQEKQEFKRAIRCSNIEELPG